MLSNSKIRSVVFVLSTLILLCAITAPAATLPARNWEQAVAQNAALLQGGNFAASLATSERMLGEMIKYLGTGTAEDQTLATVLTHRALANAGLGNIDDALWYWYIAQEIYPPAAKSDLSSFGAAGEFLQRHPFSYAGLPPEAGVVPARVLKQVAPTFPAGASRFGAGDLVVQIVINGQGRPTLPRIIHPLQAPALSLAALEALKRWQFQPARRNGEPVPAVVDLTVHYKL